MPGRNALVAAAAVISATKIRRPDKPGSKDQTWQREVWKLYDEVGELHFGLRWKAQACSRLNLVAAHAGHEPQPIVLSDEPEVQNPPDDVTAISVAESFAKGAEGQSHLLKTGALHIDAIGESYIVVYAADGCAKAFAPTDVKVQQGKWICGGKELSDDDLIMHARVPHPSDSERVDSAVRSALPVLKELYGLNQQLLNAIDSRLAGAGLLVVPQSISPTKNPPTDQDASTTPENAGEDDPFLVALIEAMMTPIQDRESAAAVVPLVVRVPDDATGKIQHIVFAQAFDPELRSLRDESIRRAALQLDMPPEIMLGTGDVNHWGQWAIDENAIKFHVIPTAQVLVDTIVEEYYRPALTEAGVQDPDRYTLFIDASELEQRADKSANAVEAYDRAEVNGAALRRELGLSEDDAPDDIERERIVKLKHDLAGTGAAAPPGGNDPGVEQTREAPQMALEPVTELFSAEPEPEPEIPPSISPEARMHSLMDAAHVSVHRALELAGKRHVSQDRSRRAQLTEPLHRAHMQFPVTGDRLDFLLEGAWSGLSQVASECLVHAVDAYTRELLLAGVEHERELLAGVFTQAGCDAA